jgi:hypothetical protein
VQPCLNPACPELAPRGSAYCDEHRRQRRQSIAKPSGAYGPVYRRQARQVKARSHGKCEVPGCGQPLFEVHGGTDLPDNLIAVCEAHHAEAHGQSRRRPPRGAGR